MSKVLCLTPPKGMCDGIVSSLRAEAHFVEKKKFPDGETYVRIPTTVSGEDVLVVHTGFPEQNDRIIEAMFVIDTLKDLGAESVTLLMPYMPYARQDRRFREGEAVSIKVVLRTLASLDLDYLIVVDIHKEYSLSEFGNGAFNVTVLPYLAERVKDELEDPLVLAPDRGATLRAKAVAAALGAPWDYLEKRRDRVTGEVTIKPKEISAQGKTVVIVDDIISTGSTLALAASHLKRAGAKKVIALVSHALMIGDAERKLREAGVDAVVTANTLAREYPSIVRVIDVSKLLAEFIEEKGLL
ncbi:MAG: ribose-phosphate pyrophosphokinase [Crenarchaeota archaeon]|nr:ribose-phosphate pyrophosphokinase [Thermoproteota archaeon]